MSTPTTAPSPARPTPLSLTAAARRVFELSFGEMLW